MRQTNRECSAGRDPNRDISQRLYLGLLRFCLRPGTAFVCNVTANIYCGGSRNYVTFKESVMN